MEILLIDPEWYNRFLEKAESIKLSEEFVKELYSNGNQSNQQDFIQSGKTAIISILGPLTKQKDFFFSLFSRNNTTYDGIVQAVQAAESDDSIEDLELQVDSPGGNWVGLTEAVNTLSGAKKPITAKITGMATSAAYVLASQADKVVSVTDGNEVGGLGVVTKAFNFGDEKTIRSSNAPNKNPDAFTKNGEKELIKQLDAIETKAFNMVSEGRSAATGKNISLAVIKKDFGRGASMLADEALKKGMIDEILEKPARVSNAKPVPSPGKEKLQQEPGRGSGLKPKHEVKLMESVEELRAEYPKLCAQLVEEGRQLERDQVKGHITMAKQTGAVEYAMECLSEGKSLSSQEVIANYLSSGAKKIDLNNREEDNPEGDLGTGGNTELSEEQKAEALLADVMKQSHAKERKEV